MTRPTLGITGASGYIGRRLSATAGRTWNVVALGRRPVPGAEFRPCSFDGPFEPAVLEGIDAVIHLAADTTATEQAALREVAFAAALTSGARERGIPIVVASSQVASASAPSVYGRTKARIEQAVLPVGAIVVRPGLVYGGEPRGLYGMLEGLCRRLPAIPALLPRPLVQPVHVDDLVAALLAAIQRPALHGRVLAIAGEPVPFDEFLASITRFRLRRRPLRLPVPLAAVRAVLAVACRIAGPSWSPQRFDSLVRIPPMASRSDLAVLDLTLRSLEDGLRRGGRHRGLLREASRLGRAFLRTPMPAAVLRRYARAIPALGVDAADPRLARVPIIALPGVDVPAERERPGSPAWRIGVLLRIAEADARLAPSYLLGQRAGLLRFGLGVLHAGALELSARAMRPWARARMAASP